MTAVGARFESIQEAQEYIRLLREVVEEAQGFIQQELGDLTSDGHVRRTDALRLVDYKLTQLHEHLRLSGRLLNDLRSLRRILYGERDLQASHAGSTVRVESELGSWT